MRLGSWEGQGVGMGFWRRSHRFRAGEVAPTLIKTVPESLCPNCRSVARVALRLVGSAGVLEGLRLRWQPEAWTWREDAGETVICSDSREFMRASQVDHDRELTERGCTQDGKNRKDEMREELLAVLLCVFSVGAGNGRWPWKTYPRREVLP